MGARVLVTGAGGFVGNHLTRFLEKKDLTCLTMGRKKPTTETHFELTSIHDRDGMAGFLRDTRPSQVFHIAGISRGAEASVFYDVNAHYAENLFVALEMAGLSDVPVVLVGSGAEYGSFQEADLPLVEEFVGHPENDYGRSKLEQTTLGMRMASKGKPVTVLRPFNIIGPGMPEYIVTQAFASQLIAISQGKQEPVIRVGNLEAYRDFMDVSDICRLFWELSQTKEAYGKIVNVCTGEATKVRDLLNQMIELSGVQVRIEVDPSRFRKIDFPKHFGSRARLESLVGPQSLVSLRSSLNQILEGVRARPQSSLSPQV